MTKVNWHEKLNPTVRDLLPSGIRAFFDIVSQRKDCISLGVGEPDFISPEPVLESAIASIRNGYTHYTANQGMLSLRKHISSYLENEYSLIYDPDEEILITVGVSQGIDIALRSIIKPQDEILYPSPGYVSYKPLIGISGGVSKKIRLFFEDDFQIKEQAIKPIISESTKGFLLNHPSNPLGVQMSRQSLDVVSKIALEHDLLVISDEIYAELTYGTKHVPIASLPNMKERTLLLGGFSKGFAMTGWRIGYACGPRDWIQSLIKIHQYSMLCAPTLSQAAAEAALTSALEHKDQMRQIYQKRRDLIVKALNEAGLPCHSPSGSFYVFPQIKQTGLSSIDFAEKLLEQQNVAVVPGNAFGEEGEGFIRCSFAASVSDIQEAIQRIRRFVSTL